MLRSIIEVTHGPKVFSIIFQNHLHKLDTEGYLLDLHRKVWNGQINSVFTKNGSQGPNIGFENRRRRKMRKSLVGYY